MLLLLRLACLVSPMRWFREGLLAPSVKCRRGICRLFLPELLLQSSLPLAYIAAYFGCLGAADYTN